ncbi:MAG: hypothetical protein AB1571_02750 [Nanoarchaeota archaeon]
MTDDVVITYETIFEILRREKYREELQKLDENFYDNVAGYLGEKIHFLNSQKDKESIFSSELQKTQKQIDNLRRMLKELYDKRESKVIQLALFCARSNTKKDYTNMLKKEIEIYDKVVDELKSIRGIVFNEMLNKKSIVKEVKELKKNIDKLKFVRFIKEVSSFVGEDLNTYGPFKAEDVANLPLKVANILIENKEAEEI